MYENGIKEKIKAVSSITNNPQNYGITQNSKPNNKNMKENNEKITNKNNENFFNSIISKVKKFWDSQTTQKTDINSITNNSPSDTSSHLPIKYNFYEEDQKLFNDHNRKVEKFSLSKMKLSSKTESLSKIEIESSSKIGIESSSEIGIESSSEIGIESSSEIGIESSSKTTDEDFRDLAEIIGKISKVYINNNGDLSNEPLVSLPSVNSKKFNLQQPKLESNNHETQRD